ncbi:STAS domain-containing protein [Candidatus Magnetomonas plexicatena]|uniref:STAS domain-containing protein n=1 Tax=Candidatus Magnetomonas plexicatena TaxID=2552947 RepID=UPI001C74F6DC|nr:STAS domain-containing protein [Nitrospirales bacterium LBB_01]
MKTNLEIRQGAAVVNVSGEINLYTSSHLRETIITLIKKKTAIIVVNMKDVADIDSSGVATFVEALNEMSKYGGKLRFVSVSAKVVKIFNFSKLDRFFEIYTDLEQAVAS